MREAQKKKTSPNTLKPMKVQQQKQLKKVSTNETSKSQSLTESKSNDISKTSASKEKMVKSLQKMPRTRKDLGFARNLGSTGIISISFYYCLLILIYCCLLLFLKFCSLFILLTII